MLSLAHGDSEHQIRSRSLPSSLTIVYCNYYIVYYNKRILEECDMEETAEVVTTPHFKKTNTNIYSYKVTQNINTSYKNCKLNAHQYNAHIVPVNRKIV
jgi:hypothetical protein